MNYTTQQKSERPKNNGHATIWMLRIQPATDATWSPWYRLYRDEHGRPYINHQRQGQGQRYEQEFLSGLPGYVLAA